MSRAPILRMTALYIALVALILAATGCARRPSRVVVVHPTGAKVVVIKKGHVHSARCGHYRHGTTWYLAAGHVHKRGCGHHKVKGVWVVRR